MKKIVILLLGVVAAASSLPYLLSTSTEVQASSAGQADRKVKALRQAECRRAVGSIELDGKLTEPAWAQAQVLKDFAVYWQNRIPKTATSARLLWDDEYLYFAAEMEDSDLYADVKEHNGMCWFNDVFELFFRPSEKSLKYYEFQVNAANTQLEMYLPSRGAGGYERFRHGRLGIESRVQLQGTLNQFEDTDRGWTVEGRIPWTGFKPTGGKPQAGDRWRFSLCRYDYSVAFESPDLSSTSPLTQPNFHRYEDYAVLEFKGQGD